MASNAMVSIKRKIIIGVALICFLCSFAVAIVSYLISYNAVLNESKQKMNEVALKTSEQFNSWLMQQGAIIDGMVESIEYNNNFDSKYLENYFKKEMSLHSYAVDIYMGFNDKNFIAASGWAPPSDYDCTNRPWYTTAVEKNGLIYTEPYLDAQTQKMIITIARPVKNQEKTIGVLSEDLYIDYLTDLVNHSKDGENSYSFLLDKTDNFIAHPNKEFQPTEKESFNLEKVLDGKFKNVLSNIKSSKTNVVEFEDYDSVKKFLAISELKSTGWSYGFVYNKAELVKPVNNLIWGFIVALLLSLIIGVIIAMFFSNQIVNPILGLIKIINEIANGNLKEEVPIEISNRNDEIGSMSNALIKMRQSFEEMISTISNCIKNLNISSNDLINCASTVTSTSEDTNKKAIYVNKAVLGINQGITGTTVALQDTSSNLNNIASSIEEITSTIDNLASSSGKTSDEVKKVSNVLSQISQMVGNVSNSATDVSYRVKSVVTSLKEINISIDGISKNCERSTQITSTAEHNANETNEIINRLKISSEEIGKIVNIISNFASQTNMLALNAAIEAAGAGESGKGFAVVANEVKELAKQTSEATSEIGQQIENMQQNMIGAVKAVQNFSEVIHEISTITIIIAAAVTQQSATTHEISGEAIKAADMVSQISEDIGKSAKDSYEVSKNITETSKFVEDIAKSASEIAESSNDVAKSTDLISTRIGEIAKISQGVSKDASEIADNIQEISNSTQGTVVVGEETTTSAKLLSQLAKELEVLVQKFNV